MQIGLQKNFLVKTININSVLKYAEPQGTKQQHSKLGMFHDNHSRLPYRYHFQQKLLMCPYHSSTKCQV